MTVRQSVVSGQDEVWMAPIRCLNFKDAIIIALSISSILLTPANGNC